MLHLYEALGVECLSRLRGMFAFALWDRRQRRLMLARDRLGIKPLSYAFTPKGDLVFGSEAKAIVALDGLRAEVNLKALNDLFSIGFVIPPHSFFKGVEQVLPGHYLLFQQGKTTVHQYWDLQLSPNHSPAANSNSKNGLRL